MLNELVKEQGTRLDLIAVDGGGLWGSRCEDEDGRLELKFM